MEQQKRARDPLEENGSSSSELDNMLKRRRLAAGGEENLDPTQSPARTCFRRAEMDVKSDTPALPSIRSRVQQLNQRRDAVSGLFQRCVSDPGSAPSASMISEISHIGEGEFSSRLERFKPPTPLNSPGRSAHSSRGLSSFVHGVQQQLGAAVTPSTKEASRIRKAREDELRLLKVPPVTENMWLKRFPSDPSLSERSSLPTSSACVFRKSLRRRCPTPQSASKEQSEGDISLCTENRKTPEGNVIETPPSSGAILFPSEELYTSSVSESGTLSTSALLDKMFEAVLHEADDDEERNPQTVLQPLEVKKEENSVESTIEKEDDSVEKEVKSENSTVENEVKMEPDWKEDRSEASTDVVMSKSVKEEQTYVDECLQDRAGAEEDEGETDQAAEDDFLTLPPACILSPLSKSVEAVVTPMKINISVSEPPGQHLTQDLVNVAPLYSIDSYRSQRKLHPLTHSGTPGVQEQVQHTSCSKQPVNIKERIKALNEEAAKLQTIMSQTLQALSCCSDEEHGKGSRQEAEAEKLLLVSSEKRTALLAEVNRLREAEPDKDQNAVLQPCRGTVSISSIQLPLKVEFLCSTRTDTPTHYFFILIRYGPYNIVETPLATAADAQNGDSITFPTSITLKDIRSSFEIDLEVYSLSSHQSDSCNNQQFRSLTKSRVTPKKILHSITKSHQTVTSSTVPGLRAQRSSNFTLVGSHKITLTSLGQSRFPLDKMKFDGKIRRLLGDEFQEKVPFLSPLEGHIYLRLHCEGHSSVQHQGFLTMFEMVGGFGAWHRFYFFLEKGHLLYWNYPSYMGIKPADGSVSLSCFSSVRLIDRNVCARPHTFELVEAETPGPDDSNSSKKFWFSADTQEDRMGWMEKLQQILLDSQTWNRQCASSRPSTSTSCRESIL